MMQYAESNFSAKDLVVGWEDTPVANVDTLSVSAGDIMVIAGPNGAGKSTVLKTLARQISAISGNISVNGVDARSLGTREFARMVAYVPQLIEVPPQITVEEYVLLGRSPHQRWWSWEVSSQDKEAVDGALARTELESLRQRALHDLSGGERQRAAIAMALAQRTTFILLDEPTAHLDFRHQLQLLDLLEELRASGKGIIMVLHDLNLTARVATRVLLLSKEGTAGDKNSADRDQGVSKAVIQGSIEQALDPGVLRSVFQVDVTVLKDPASNLIAYIPNRPVQ